LLLGLAVFSATRQQNLSHDEKLPPEPGSVSNAAPGPPPQSAPVQTRGKTGRFYEFISWPNVGVVVAVDDGTKEARIRHPGFESQPADRIPVLGKNLRRPHAMIFAQFSASERDPDVKLALYGESRFEKCGFDWEQEASESILLVLGKRTGWLLQDE